MPSHPSYRVPHLLPNVPAVPQELVAELLDDWQQLARQEPPASLTDYVSAKYGLDVSTEYAGIPLSCPWGKASGQLSMNTAQVQDDIEAGLGFIVLKTVIAEDEQQQQSMAAWAVQEARMLVEPIEGESGETGWNVSWKGRGWWQSFEDYLELVRQARQLSVAAGQGDSPGTLIVPSCKYHLPTPEETGWKVEEYHYTTSRLLEAWYSVSSEAGEAMPLEKDFSPTLAGSDHSLVQQQILHWLSEVPRLIREGASHGPPSSRPAGCSIRIGLKLFNALFDEEFQLQMLRAVHQPGPGRPDFLIYGNRLFDLNRDFEGRRGIAYGGPDLSDRNLRVLEAFQQEWADLPGGPLPCSATGNITSGKMALEYALRGCSTFQLHTFFQLPGNQYRRQTGSRTQRALHELYLHPKHGLVVWMHHLAATLGLNDSPIRLRDLVGRGLELQR
ncbi:MAG: hypothetical protein KDA79_11485 [Planctomycetaceae bacterium]|nr:hypothetical protein [Planctomycetaceae bacterium]